MNLLRRITARMYKRLWVMIPALLLFGQSCPSTPETQELTIDFGASLSSLGVTIDADFIRNWSTSYSAEWIDSVSPSSGSQAGGDGPFTVTVTIDRTKLSPGENTAEITVNSGSDYVTVHCKAVPSPNPLMVVSPTALSFTESVTEGRFTISNRGGGTLSYHISETAPWITGLNESSTPGEVVVTVDPTRANSSSKFTYIKDITITSNGGDGLVRCTLNTLGGKASGQGYSSLSGEVSCAVAPAEGPAKVLQEPHQSGHLLQDALRWLRAILGF